MPARERGKEYSCGGKRGRDQTLSSTGSILAAFSTDSPAPTSQADGQLVWGRRTMRSSHTILESAIFYLTISSVLVGAVSADGGHLSLRGGGHGQGWERRSASFSDHER